MTRRVGFSLVCLLFLVTTGQAGEREPTKAAVTYEDDRLTVRLENVEVGEALAAIGRATGAEIRGELGSHRRISLTLDDLPPIDALTRLLEKQPFFLRYRKGHLSVIELVAMATAPSPSGPQEGETGAASLNALERPVPVEASLLDALGEQRVPLMRVVDAALEHPDAEVRDQAARAALGALESDADLRQAFLASWNGVDPRFVAQVLGGTMGGEAFVTYLADHAHSEVLRSRAVALLRQMRVRQTQPSS